MLKLSKGFLAALAMFSASLTWAQETEISDSLAIGQSVEPTIVTEEFGDWALNCQTVNEIERCQLFQLLIDSNNNPVVEFNMFPVPEGGLAVAGGTIIAPLETLLTANLLIAVDEKTAKRYPFAFCTVDGCIARVGFTQEDIDIYKKGSQAIVQLVPAAAPEQPINLVMSLTGFTKAFDALVAKGAQ